MKYYTPSLEEFYVGFDYEEYKQKEWSKLISPPKSLGYEWVSKVFNTSTSLSKIKNQITGINSMDWMIDGIDQEHPSCKIRVKYLDEQDFIDLGFIKSEIDSLGYIYFTKSSYTIAYYPPTMFIDNISVVALVCRFA